MYYRDYTLHDFVTDSYFVQWVKQPDPEHDRFWNNWIKENPDKKELIEEAKLLVLSLDFRISEPSPADFSEVKSKLFQQIKADKDYLDPKENPASNQTHKDKAYQKPASLRYFKVAAIFIGLLVLSYLYFLVFPINQFTQYETAYGETKEVMLPDSSIVVLNANSTLKVAHSWEKAGIREVWLEGEAFFSVLKKQASGESSKQPIKFIVRANSLNVEVIGTTFNVNNRRGTTEVVLKTGKVKLHINSHSNNIEMVPGELVEFSENEKSFKKKTVEPENYASWRNNKLTFDNQSLEEIFKVLEDHYGYEVIIIDPELAKLTFTGITPLDNPDVLLTSISNSFDVTIKKENNKLTVLKN